ncbi:LCP family protein [Deinococcus sp.]|uniref:LCP family protein n=1 Tax=Deinococcus sp. TaxID=47478 RepID=UPI003CC60A99
MRLLLVLSLALAGVLALLAPALPALGRYGAWPRTPDGPLNLLLAGVTPNYPPSPVWPYPAAPEDYSGLTDTIVLAQLRPGGSVELLSIPRDTWTTLPGWGESKINAANRHGGAQMLVGAVQKLTGLHVDSYALLSLNALRDLTEAAGGVTLTVPEDMKYDDAAGKLHIDLRAGRQHLSGQQVEGFLRFRHDALGDIGRVSRQQLFLGALASQLRSPLNLWRLPAVVGALNRNARSNLDRQQFGTLLGALLHGPKVSTVTLPGSFGPGGTWTPDRAGIRSLVQTQFADPGDPRGLKIALINVNAPSGTARRLKAKLEAAGYTAVSTDTHLGPLARSTVSGAPKAAGTLLAELGFGVPDAASPQQGYDLTVRLGADVK